jgi:tetratricopeptide (TPR) repeat protein
LEWGRSLATMKRYPAAIRKFKSAIEIDPSSEFPYKDWGDALKAMGREAEELKRPKSLISGLWRNRL